MVLGKVIIDKLVFDLFECYYRCSVLDAWGSTWCLELWCGLHGLMGSSLRPQPIGGLRQASNIIFNVSDESYLLESGISSLSDQNWQ